MSQQLTRNLQQTVSAGHLCLTALPQCPDISLYLISEDYPRGRLPDEEMLAIMERPAYWAFCWASGQVLAAHLLVHPEICRNRTVLDLGAGSGVVAIAAAMTGASRVIACDLDHHALDASRINAEANGVSVELLDDLEALDERCLQQIATCCKGLRSLHIFCEPVSTSEATVTIEALSPLEGRM